MLRRIHRITPKTIYDCLIMLMLPLNFLLVKIRKRKVYPNSVLHIAFMVHVPYYTVQILRKYGMKADKGLKKQIQYLVEEITKSHRQT